MDDDTDQWQSVYDDFDHVVVHTDAPRGAAQGTAFRRGDRIYIAIPKDALGSSPGDSSVGPSIQVSVVDRDGARLDLGEVPKSSFVHQADSPQIVVADITGRSVFLDNGRVPLPIVVQTGAVDETSIVGEKLGAFWREGDTTSPMTFVAVHGIDTLDGEGGVIRISPPLPESAVGAPFFNESGQLVGIGKSVSAGGLVHGLTPIPGLVRTIETGVPAVPPDASPWRNPEGLAELLAHLSEHGFDAIVSWSIVELVDGAHATNHIPATAGAARAAFAVVSEAPEDELNLVVRNKTLEATDDGPERNAAVEIVSPDDIGYEVDVVEPRRSSTARLLVIEIASTASLAGSSLRPGAWMSTATFLPWICGTSSEPGAPGVPEATPASTAPARTLGAP